MNAATQTKSKGSLIGVISRIVYSSDGFLIARLDSDNTVLGNMLEPAEGQEYEFHGKWVQNPNPKYDELQFKFTRYTTCLPQSTDGIKRYLVRAKWVKMRRARLLVEAYGKDTLTVLKEDPERIAKDINGITLERALEIQTFLRENEKLEAACVEIEGILGKVKGLPASLARDLIARHGSDAPTVLRKDPYILTQFHRVGFKLADSVALLNDFPKDGVERKAAAIVHVLQEAAGKGHTCLPKGDCTESAENLIGHPPAAGYKHLLETDPPRIAQPNKSTMALASINADERSIAGIVRAFMETPLISHIKTPAKGLEEDQVQAVELIGKHRFSVLTGPPGSGKTYAFARFVPALRKAGFKRVGFCAPTGKAAQRMTESLQDTFPGAQAQTIHRILGPQPDPKTGEFTFRHGKSDPIPYNALIVDETSMIDTSLCARLLEATTVNMIVLFVGDPDQLPSIGPGSVLKNFMDAGVPTARLDKIKRNAGQIVRACHKIRTGDRFEWSPKVDLEAGENFRHIRKVKSADIIDTIVQIAVKKTREIQPDLDPFWDFQALAPMNVRSEVSVKALNDALAPALNPSGVTIKGLDFSIGDKVIRLRNAVVPGEYRGLDKFDRGISESKPDEMLSSVPVVNGDIGKVLAIHKGPTGKQRIVAYLRNPDRIVYLPRMLHHLARAFAVTAHKMQGSDAPVIAMPLHKSFGKFPTRNLLYTAISRAKMICLTVGDANVAYDMLKRVESNRRTKLAERIQGNL